MYVGNVTEYYKHFHRHSIPKPMVLELDFLFSNIILIKKNKGTKSVCNIEEKVCIVTTYKVYRWHKATAADIVYDTFLPSYCVPKLQSFDDGTVNI